MRQLTIPSIRFLLALLVSFHVDAFAAEVLQKEITISGPTIIAFVPVDTKGQQDDGSIEGIAHMHYAMQDTCKCLSPKKVAFQFWFADRLVIHSGLGQTTFEVGKFGQGFGAILVEPGRTAKVVFSVDGPSTLQYLLPQAAFEYWQASGCKNVD